jgi:LmbE family N-acetylglucosaminyl deacetylase
MIKPERVMVVAAHPHDIELLAGGLVAYWVRGGIEVTYVIVANGDQGSDAAESSHERLIATRRDEQLQAAASLGVSSVLFLDYEGGPLQSTLELRRDLARVIRERRPNIVVSFDPTARVLTSAYSNDPNHRAAGAATVDAVLEDGLRPHEVNELWLFGTGSPNHWIDIEPVLDRKLAALRKHESQLDGIPLAETDAEFSRTRAEGGPYALAEGFRRVVITPDGH